MLLSEEGRSKRRGSITNQVLLLGSLFSVSPFLVSPVLAICEVLELESVGKPLAEVGLYRQKPYPQVYRI